MTEGTYNSGDRMAVNPEASNRQRVLLVDDDANIIELLTLYFEKAGYLVSSVLHGDEVMAEFHSFRPDVIILDLMLPGRDGYDICRDLRKESDVPVIMLTARGDTLDKVVGLELGADDYVQKPFDSKELLARVRAVLRRTQYSQEKAETVEADSDTVRYPGLLIDKAQFLVEIGGQVVDMPPKELELLYFFATHPNRVFTREQLLSSVWGYDFFGESRTVDVHVKRIREKMDEIGQDFPWNIKTVWGVGYKFETQV